MDKFHWGNTINCKRNVKDPDTGEYFDPATSMKITINNKVNGIEVDNQDMIKDTTGQYHYKYTPPANAPLGVYKVTYTATDGADIGVFIDSFQLV